MKVVSCVLASAVYFVTFILIVLSSSAVTTSKENCRTAPLLKKRNCRPYSCKVLFNGTFTNRWNKIKCSPFPTGARTIQCSKWCRLFTSFFDRGKIMIKNCKLKFRTVSQFQISGKSSSRNISPIFFKVVPCRPFVFIIKVSADQGNDTRIQHSPYLGSPFPVRIKNFVRSIINIKVGQRNALQNAVSLFETTIRQRMGILEDQREDTVFTTILFEDFIVRVAQEQLNATTLEVFNVSKDLEVRARRVVHKDESEFLLNGTNGENVIKIPSANLNETGTVVLGVAYNNLHELISNYSADTNGTNKTRELNSIIMSAVIYPQPEVLPENVTLVFKNIKVAGKKNLKRECVFWKFSEDNPGSWSSEGCHTRLISNSQTECVCNHLTHFAVLMDFTDSDDEEDQTRASVEHDRVLTLLTQVGIALSLTGVVLTIISYVLLTERHAPLCHIRLSLTSCIGAGQIIFLAGIDATGNKGACVTVAALMQYFLMAAFCWMLVEGIYLYLFVVKVYNITDKIGRYHGFCWGFPAFIVAMTLSIAAGKDGVESFVSDKHCWMSSTNKFIWIFVSFVGLIELINIAILLRVIKEITTTQQVKDNQAEQIRLGVRACVVLVPLLGVTWLFGFLSPLHIAFSYVFVILNSTQGFSVFFFHCLKNSEIKERFKRRLQTVCPSAVNTTPVEKSGISQVSHCCDSSIRDADVTGPVDTFDLQE